MNVRPTQHGGTPPALPGWRLMADERSEPAVSGPLALSLKQWWRVLIGVNATQARTGLPLIAGGLAFFSLLALIPGIAALVALLGVVGDPSLARQAADAIRGVAPDAAVRFVEEQLSRLLAVQSEALALSALVNLVIAFWSALQGTRWGLIALTMVNRRADQRSFLRGYKAAAAFTLYGIGLSMLVVLLLGVAPLVLSLARIDSHAEATLLALRWPILAGAAVGVAFILYRWGPRRRPPPWRWIWPGAILAPLLWLLASSALTVALRAFPAFGAAYGSLASALALLLWLYVTALVFLLGGALNAELEFYARGRPAAPVTPDEKIEPPIAADGGKKEVAP